MLTTYHGLVSYDTGQVIQLKTHEKVSAGGEDETLIFEHPHVYTLGRLGRHEDILIEGQRVKKLGIEIKNTDRGGEVTYHGPGQLVVYPIVKLDRIAYSPSKYVRALKISIIDCLDALRNRDIKASQQVIDDDDAIDEKQQDIENTCIDLIALEAPMAGDLRVIISVMMMATELERIGDYAEGIGKISLAMGDLPPLKPLIDIPRMADLATDMLRRSISAFVNRDTAVATSVRQDDDIVDDLYDQVYRELLTFMMADTSTIQRATYLLWVAHDIERVADRTTNISERVIWLVTGQNPD